MNKLQSRMGRDLGRRVLVTLNSLEMGGTQLNALDLASRMAEWGFECHLVGWDGPRMGLLEVAKQRGISIEVLGAPKTSLGKVRALAGAFVRYRPDLVHVYSSTDARAGFWGPARFGRVPLILTVYEMSVPRNFYKWPGLVVGTGYLAKELRFRPGATVLVRPPVDMRRDQPSAVKESEFRAADIPGRNLRLVLVSRVERVMKAKHIEVAIRSLPNLPRNVDLFVVGTGDAIMGIGGLAEEMNRELGRQAVHMVGELVDPRPAYASADVILGMGSSAARGLAFGKPLIVIGENGVPELFTKETCASLLYRSFWNETRPSATSARVEDLIAPLLGDHELRVQLGIFGRAFAMENFSLDKMAERLAELYTRMMAGGSWRRHWIQDSLLDLPSAPSMGWTNVQRALRDSGR